jgi:hypothetical protein
LWRVSDDGRYVGITLTLDINLDVSWLLKASFSIILTDASSIHTLNSYSHVGEEEHHSIIDLVREQACETYRMMLTREGSTFGENLRQLMYK